MKTWRAVELEKQPSSHRKYECWASADEAWKAETFDGGKLWYARLRVGTHRFTGKDSSMPLALEKARAAAARVELALRQIIEETGR